jgi:hypothetical protein
MANMHQRYRPGPEAIGPFAIALLFVVINIVVGYAVMAMTGAPGVRQSAPLNASEMSAQPTCTETTPATATVGLAHGGAGQATLTSGFVPFDRGLIDGGAITDFGPPPASVCRKPLDDDDDSMPMEALR